MDDNGLDGSCLCPDPLLCRRLGRHVCGRLWQIWTDQATDLDAANRQGYRDEWTRQAARWVDAPGQLDALAEVKPAMTDRPFDRIVLVNLPRRADRLAAALDQLQPPAWTLGKPEVFPAIDGARVPTPPGYEQGGGAWGCLSSHRRIIEQALLDGVEHLLVLEDDIALRRGFSESLSAFLSSVPGDADGLYLGGQHHAAPEDVSPGIVRCINTQRTHAYSARRRWLEELYRIWHAPRLTVHCDWVMGPACRRFRIYAPSPWLIGQRADHSDITCKRQPAKFWQPPTGQEPVVVLRAERPVVDQLREVGWHTGFQRDSSTGYDVGLVQVAVGRKGLRSWLDELMWEVVSEDGWLLAVWHPQITVDAVKAAWPGPVVEIYAPCANRAIREYRQWVACLPKGSAAG